MQNFYRLTSGKKIPELLVASMLWAVAPGAVALSHNLALETGCTYGDLRGTTLIKPEGIILDDVYENSCQITLGGDLLASEGAWDLQLSGWAEQWYAQDAAGKDEEDLHWRWQSSHIRWSGERLQLSLGVTNYEQGPGYAWNPVNPFFDIRLNERDKAIPFRREADPMAAASWSDDHGLWRLMAVDHEAFPYDYASKGHERYSYLLTREQLFESSQLTINLASLEDKPFVGFSYEWTASDNLELHGEFSWREGRKFPGFVVTELFPGGWLAEYPPVRDDDIWFNGLLGLQYSFNNNLNLIVEYFYQEDGYNQSDWNDLRRQVQQQHQQWQGNVLADPSLGFLLTTHQWLRLLHRDYVFVRMAMPDIWSDAELALFARHDLVDSSWIAGAVFEKPLSDHLSFHLSFQASYGSATSEGHWVPHRNEFTAALQYHF